MENTGSFANDQRFLYISLITILFGPEQASFAVHKELLCDRSEFFRAPCNGNFKEAEGIVELPEQDAAIFKYFIYWLYTEKLRGYFRPESTVPTKQELTRKVLSTMNITCLNERHLIHNATKSEKAQEASAASDEANYRDLPFTALVSLYILADSLLIRGLEDTVVTSLIEVYGYDRLSTCPQGITLDFWAAPSRRKTTLPSPVAGINLAWKKTCKSCHLRDVLVELFCDNIDGGNRLEQPYDAEFLSEAIAILANRWIEMARDNEIPGTSDWGERGAICNFHTHDVECQLQDNLKE